MDRTDEDRAEQEPTDARLSDPANFSFVRCAMCGIEHDDYECEMRPSSDLSRGPNG